MLPNRLRYRMSWAMLGLALGFIPGTYAASGFLERLGREMSGGTVDSIRAMVPQAAVVTATDKLCGNTPDAWCRSLTDTVVGGFSTEFIERMTREDLEQATSAREQSIRTGEPQVWENPETGARGTAESVPAPPRPATPTEVVVEAPVQLTAPILDAVGEPYRVRAQLASVMSGPGVDFAPVAELRAGDQINAIARVQGSDWYLIGEGPIGKGYLDGVLIEPAPRERAPAQPAAPPKPKPTPAKKPEADAEPPANTRKVAVAMAAECYTTTQRVTLADGTSEQASVTSCRTPDGWVQV